MADHQGDRGPAEGEGKPPMLLEFLLLVWAVLALGYFYYTQGFFGLAKELWGQAFG
ncbi:MAG: hypothetical protein IT369_17875 [Candidatus Latescibacteria bacterium]|nr:hypothetical protein [Candidatus Latescibacterota bacterium]